MLSKLLKVLFGKKEENRLTEVEESMKEAKKSKPHIKVSGNTYSKSTRESSRRIVEVDNSSYDYSPRGGLCSSSYPASSSSSSCSSSSSGDSSSSSSCSSSSSSDSSRCD